MHSNSVSERRILWNETLNACGSRGFLNLASAKDFKSFINTYDLLEYHLHGHRYTWCRGSSMSRIDRAFASPACHRQFPDMVLTRFSRGLSNHCQLVLGPTTQNWGWKLLTFGYTIWDLWRAQRSFGEKAVGNFQVDSVWWKNLVMWPKSYEVGIRWSLVMRIIDS
jgi:hypothetical protein